ncbi:MAG: multidrug transporter [Sphingomonas bacterium]|nr:multidrug transporter [Sphingomonas bacterium]
MTNSGSPGGLAGERRALAFLLLVVFINIAGFGIVIPLLPFFAETFGIDAWQVTILFSAFSVGQLFGETFFGRLSDRIGRRPVLIGSILAGSLFYALLAFAPNYATAFVLRLLGGFAAGNISTVQAYVADISPPERRVRRLGLIGSIFGLGFVVGPAIGGLLTDPTMGAAGYRPPLLISAALGLVAALGLFLFVRESRHAVHAPPIRGRFAVLHDAWASPVLRRVLLSTMVATGAFSAMEAVFALWAHARFGWGPREVGLIFAFIGTISAITQAVLVGPVVRWLGEANTLALGLLVSAVTLFLQAISPTGAIVVAVTTFTVIGVSITNPAIAGLISRATRADHQGAMLGLNGSASALSRILGPIIAGFLFSGVGVNAPFYFAAAMTLPAVLLAVQAGQAVRRADPV